MEKQGQKEKVAERIALNITPDKKRFCNVCDTQLLPDYSCGKCGIYYLPEQAKHEVIIKGLDGKEPGLNTNTIPVASIDTPSTPRSKRKMTALYESLEKQGFKFTSYTETNV